MNAVLISPRPTPRSSMHSTGLPARPVVVASRQSLRDVQPSLLRRIAHVVHLGADEQVVGPDTSRVVASVEYGGPDRDRSVVEFPRVSVGVARMAAIRCESALSRPADSSAGPYPASIALADLFPEAVGGWTTRMIRVVASWRAKTVAIALGLFAAGVAVSHVRQFTSENGATC